MPLVSAVQDRKWQWLAGDVFFSFQRKFKKTVHRVCVCMSVWFFLLPHVLVNQESVVGGKEEVLCGLIM